VSVDVRGYQGLSSGNYGRVVDVVPVDGGWRRDPDHACVQSGAQVEPDCVWMVANESRRHLIKLFSSECDVENEILVYLELLEVVVELADNLVSRCVGENWLRQRLSSALEYRVRNRLSSTGVKAGRVIAIDSVPVLLAPS
jgi:hypothetical protein